MLPDETCVAHQFHSPRPQRLDEHYLFPLEWGGAEGSERVLMCQTGHTNVHLLLDEYERAGKTPPWPVRRQFGPGERHLVEAAWRLKRGEAESA